MMIITYNHPIFIVQVTGQALDQDQKPSLDVLKWFRQAKDSVWTCHNVLTGFETGVLTHLENFYQGFKTESFKK